MVTTATPVVPVRTPDFSEQLADLPRHFARDGDIVMSHILAVLSAVFPDGEDYFVASVEAAREQVSDPELQAAVDGFVGQESMHGKEHRILNERLADLGYPTRAIARYVRGLMGLRLRFQGTRTNVACTAALEHYTATLAETLLNDPAARDEIGHAGVRSLLLWHALEEAEHKAVAFDVYRAIGGSEWMRSAVMWLTHLTFVLETGAWTLVSLAGDAEARRHPGRVLQGLWRLRRSPFTELGPVRQLFSYHRRGFHPNDRDTRELIEEWRRRLFGADGDLQELLAG